MQFCMPYALNGDYYSLWIIEDYSMMVWSVSLLCWEMIVLLSVGSLLVYLILIPTKIPSSTLRKLQLTTGLSLITILALLSQFIDATPAIFLWICLWSPIALLLLLVLLALELFKTFSVLGGHFSTRVITLVQRCWVGWYFVCMFGQYVILFGNGQVIPSWILTVRLV